MSGKNHIEFNYCIQLLIQKQSRFILSLDISLVETLTNVEGPLINRNGKRLWVFLHSLNVSLHMNHLSSFTIIMKFIQIYHVRTVYSIPFIHNPRCHRTKPSEKSFTEVLDEFMKNRQSSLIPSWENVRSFFFFSCFLVM